jgi:hypothetical protein
MQILDGQEHGSPFGQATDDAEDPFQQTRLAALGDGTHRHVRACAVGRTRASGDTIATEDVDAAVEPDGEVWEQPAELVAGGAEDGCQVGIVELGEGRSEGADDRPVGLVGAATMGATAQDEHRLLEGTHPPDRLVDEARRPGTGRAVDEQRAGVASSCRSEHGRK